MGLGLGGGLGGMILTLNGPTVVQSNSNSPHDHPYNAVLTLAICGVAQPRVLQLVWVGRSNGCAQEVMEVTGTAKRRTTASTYVLGELAKSLAITP